MSELVGAVQWYWIEQNYNQVVQNDCILKVGDSNRDNEAWKTINLFYAATKLSKSSLQRMELYSTKQTGSSWSKSQNWVETFQRLHEKKTFLRSGAQELFRKKLQNTKKVLAFLKRINELTEMRILTIQKKGMWDPLRFSTKELQSILKASSF